MRCIVDPDTMPRYINNYSENRNVTSEQNYFQSTDFAFPPCHRQGPKNWDISHQIARFKNMVHFADLAPIQSFATEFSWTSRFQNHNLHGLSSSWTAFHQDLTTGPRVIQDFVPKFLENPHALLKWICPAVVPIKCCSSTEKAISVSTSHFPVQRYYS